MNQNMSLEERVVLCKHDMEDRNQLIKEYQPFIATIVKNYSGKYMEYGVDDELSIGLMAFNEAIEAFDDKKSGFLSFAKLVISRRLMDYNKKNIKHSYYTQKDYDNEIELIDSKSIEEYAIKNENNLRKLEIESFKEELDNWDITFDDLIKHSPKHKKIRQLYKEMAKTICDNQELLDYILKNKRIPIKKLSLEIKVHRKKIERGRIYIIALIIIQLGTYDLLQEYI